MTGDDPKEKAADCSEAFAELRGRYDELQLRVTRFSAVEHELTLARQRLDRQLTIHRRIEQFNAAALQAGEVGAEFATLTAEAIADIFEVEIGLFAEDHERETPYSWGMHGIALETARELIRHLADSRHRLSGAFAWLVPADVLAQLLKGPPLKHVMMIGGRKTDGSMWPLIIAANTCDGARFYEEIQAEDLAAGSMLAEQVFAHVESRRSREAISASLREKEALLKEVHHRVKNNLQVVTSLLRLESRRTTSLDCRAIVTNLQGRVRSMALLHETLYRGDSFASVNLGSYLNKIATESFRLGLGGNSHVRLQLNLAPAVSVDIGQATACGLLLNELISNSLKHAFGDIARGGVVQVVLDHDLCAGVVSLEVNDDGIGLPCDFAERAEQSLGLQLAKDLAHQLGGGLAIGPPPIARFVVKFGIKPAKTMAL